MSFDAGSASGRIALDVTGVTGGIAQAVGSMIPFPGFVAELIEGPLHGLGAAAKEAFEGIKAAFSGENPFEHLAGAAKEGADAIVEALQIIGKEAVAGIVESFEHVAHAAHEIGVEAEKVGVSAEFLGGFGKAAESVGGSVEALSGGIKFLGRNAAEAVEGNKELLAAFQRVGLSAEDVRANMGDLQGLFMRVAEGINGLGTASEQSREAMALLGRGGIDLAGVFKNLDEVKELQGTLGRLGANITEPMVEAGHKVGELGQIFDGLFDGLKNAVATPLLEGFADNFDAIVANVISVSDALRPKLAAIGEAIVPYILPAIDMLKDLGLSLAGLIPDADSLKTTFAGVFSVFKGVADVVTGVLVPALQVVETVAKPIVEILSGLAQVVGTVFSVVGATGNAVSNAFSGSAATPPAPSREPVRIPIEGLDRPPVEAGGNTVAREVARSLPPTVSTPQQPDRSPESQQGDEGGFASIARDTTSGFAGVKDSLASVGDLLSGSFAAALTQTKSMISDMGDLLTGSLAPAVRSIDELLKPLIADLQAGINGQAGAAAASGASAGAGATTVYIESLNVPKIDVNEASSAIAGKIQEPLQRALRSQREGLEAAAQRVDTAEGL